MFALANTLAAAGFVPARITLELAMLAACRAAGAAAWYVPDDFLTLGPNLIANGGPFVNSTGWANTAGTTASISGSYLRCTTTLIGGVTYSIQTTPGKQYLVSSAAAASDVSHGLRIFRADGGTIIVDSTYSASPGVLTVTFTAIDATSSVYLRSASSGVVDYSSVTVQEILSAKDFQDSAGTLPSYLGSTVGMMFDAASVVGPELIANPHTSANWVAEGTTPPTSVNGADSYLGKSCRSITFPVIASGGYAVCRARDAENIFNVVIGTNYMASMEYALSRDLTAGESVSIAITGASFIYGKNLSAGAPGGVWMSASGGQPAVASGGGMSLRPYALTLNAPLTVYVRAVSVKATGGYVATQATAGNRPLVSRIPRKLGPELVTNGTFDADASWTKGTGWSISGGLATKAAGVAANLDQVVNLSGKNVAVSFTVSGRTAGTVSALLVESEVGTSTLGSASANGIFTFIGARPTTGVFRINSDSVFDGSIDNISVREVLEWSYALNFDGTNDSLAAPASIIGSNLSQPYTMIAWGRVGAVGAGRRMIGENVRQLGIDSAGKATIGHNAGAVVGTTTLSQGQLVILEATYNGSTCELKLNNSVEYSGSIVAPAGTVTATMIGQSGASVAYWNDQIGGAVVCPAVMTDAQRLAVRKFAAAQMGVTL